MEALSKSKPANRGSIAAINHSTATEQLLSTKKKVLLLYTGGTMGMKRDKVTGSLRPEPGNETNA
jgi:L-asparaginase/Glu-tRNA(Gln) amidotransferase subunit D